MLPPPPDLPQGGSDRFAPPAGCVGTIVGAVAACLLAFAGARVLSGPASKGMAASFGASVALGYVGLLIFSLRTSDAAHRGFARGVLVSVPIVLAVIFAVLFAIMSGVAIPV